MPDWYFYHLHAKDARTPSIPKHSISYGLPKAPFKMIGKLKTKGEKGKLPSISNKKDKN